MTSRATYRSSLLKISLRWLRTTVRTDDDAEPFEVRGAARQLAHSTARRRSPSFRIYPVRIALELLQKKRGPDAVAALDYYTTLLVFAVY